MAIVNHLIYLLFSTAFTVGVGRSLYVGGTPFLRECFSSDSTAAIVNRLFLVGFYLLNFAFVLVTLRFGEIGTDLITSVEHLSTRIGTVVMTMGVMHFNNLYWCTRIKRALPESYFSSL